MGIHLDEQIAKTRALLGEQKDVVPVLPKTKSEVKVLTDDEVLENQEGVLNAVQIDAPAYKSAMVLSPEASRGGEAVRKPPSIRNKRVVSDIVQIRDFPRELMSIARSEFPNAQNNTDALAAYVFAKSGKNLDVPDTVRDLASKWEGDKSIANMEKRITAIERQGFLILQLMEEMQLMLSYVTFDRLGYRKENPKSVREVNFLEVGVADLRIRLQEQAKQQRNQKAIRDGRPIR